MPSEKLNIICKHKGCCVELLVPVEYLFSKLLVMYSLIAIHMHSGCKLSSCFHIYCFWISLSYNMKFYFIVYKGFYSVSGLNLTAVSLILSFLPKRQKLTSPPSPR